MKNTFLIKALSIVLSLLLVSCVNENKKITLTLGHTLDTRHVVHLAMVYMAERLDFYSNGSMEIVIYPGGTIRLRKRND